MPRNLDQSNIRFHDALARVIAEVVEFTPGMLVTLVKTVLTPDTKHATGTLSVLPTSREPDALHALRLYEHDIKDGLAHELRMRRIPHLHWRFDHTEEEAAKIDAEINNLKKKGEL
jgi:ribosome-binding factor A